MGKQRKPARDGRYHIQWRGTDPLTGKPRRYHVAGKTEVEAEAAADELRRSLAGPLDPDVKCQTLREFLMDFLRAKRADVSPETIRSYESKLFTHVLPRLGATKVGSVTPLMLDTTFRTMAGSQRTRHATFRTLSSAFRRAVVLGQLDRNPCDALRMRKGQRQRGDWLTPEQALVFLEACEAEDSDYADCLALMLLTGLRKSEALGLRWEDVHGMRGVVGNTLLAPKGSVETRRGSLPQCAEQAGSNPAAYLQIRQTRQRVIGKDEHGKPFGLVVRPVTKNEESASSVALHTAAQAVLRRVKARQKVVSIGVVQRDDDRHARVHAGNSSRSGSDALGGIAQLVFGACQEITLGRTLKRLLAENGLPAIRVHDLRHSYASTMIAAGVDLHVVQKALRHSSYQTTADLYLHLVTAAKQDAAAKLEGLIFGTAQRQEEMG